MPEQGEDQVVSAADLRVRFITRKWPPTVGGMETYALRLSEELAPLCDLEIVYLSSGSVEHPPSTRDLIRFGLTSVIGVLFSRNPPDIAHVADMASWPIAFSARMRWPSARLVLSAHGTDVSFAFRSGVPSRLYQAYMTVGRWLLPDVPVIANSGATADALHELGFNNTSVIPLATDPIPPQGPAPLRRVVLFAGRIIPLKGLRWFVEQVLPGLAPDIRLEVAGTIWDTNEARCLDADRVDYLGPLTRADLDRAHATSLCTIAPNLAASRAAFEGFGLIATEVAAAGGVVLASASGGLQDSVLDGKTGFLLPPGDADAWVSKITEIASWPAEDRATFTSAARAESRAHFNWARVARQTMEVYCGKAKSRC